AAWLELAVQAAAHGSIRGGAARVLRAARARSIPFASRTGARLLAANALDPTHPAVIAFVSFLAGSSWTPLALVAPGLARMSGAADGAAAPSRGHGPRKLSAIERSV